MSDKIDYRRPYWMVMTPGAGSDDFRSEKEAVEWCLTDKDGGPEQDNGWFVIVECIPRKIILCPDGGIQPIDGTAPKQRKRRQHRSMMPDLRPASVSESNGTDPLAAAREVLEAEGTGPELPGFLDRRQQAEKAV